MSWLLAILAAIVGSCFLIVLFGTAVVALDVGVPMHPSRAGLGCFAREWAGHVLAAFAMPCALLVPRARPAIGPARHPVPVVLLPGYLMNQACFWPLSAYLRRRGWAWVLPLNNRPRSAPVVAYARALDEHIEAYCKQTGAAQVDIVAHSMGGIIAAIYVNRMGGTRRVRRLVTLGTPWQGTRMWVFAHLRQGQDLAPGCDAIVAAQHPAVPATQIWSRADHLVIPSAHNLIDGVAGIEVERVGHVSLLLSAQVWRHVAQLLSDDGQPAGLATAQTNEADPVPLEVGGVSA
jgi:predicted alpha/beta hydrolase family esterase